MLKDINDKQVKRIFCYLRGCHHFDLFYNIFRNNPCIDFYIHSNFIKVDEYRKSKLYLLENVYFVSDLNAFKFKLNLFGAFITTDAQSTSPHSYSLQLILLFKKLSIPVIELQHGLFQLGLHYFDCPYKEIFHDDSLPTKSWADHILAYYPINNCDNISVIGYPPYDQNLNAYTGEYVLILSNMHWKSYSVEEKYAFYKTVLQFVENSDGLFVWKMHHGEIQDVSCQNMLKNLFLLFPNAQDKIIFFHQNDMFQRNSVVRLIQKSRWVISTVSTVLLDCEIYHKKAFVFKCDSNLCLVQKLKDSCSFRDCQELKTLSMQDVEFKTGLLQKYNNAVFLDCINKLYKSNVLNTQDCLDVLLSF